MTLTIDLIRILYIRFANIFGQKFNSNHTPDIISLWYEDWLDGLMGIDPICFKDALSYCKKNLEWPPSIAEFIRICDIPLNIPTPSECLYLAVNRDFSNPMVKKIYDEIGSWDMSNGTRDDLLKRASRIHEEEMIRFRNKRSKSAYGLKEIKENSNKLSHGSEENDNQLQEK